MKVIGFSSGSTGRDTNVDRLVKAIIDRSGHDGEFVKLTDLTYSACKGCVQLCSRPQVCMLEDDLFPYYQKIKEADAVVLGSPVYFGAINAAMTAFIERFFGYRHVTIAVRDKPFVLALTGGSPRVDRAAERFQRALMPFRVNVLDTVTYRSDVFPCYRCGRHQECSIGGMFHTIGEAAHTLTVIPEHFHRWEDHPPVVEAIEAAAGQIREL